MNGRPEIKRICPVSDCDSASSLREPTFPRASSGPSKRRIIPVRQLCTGSVQVHVRPTEELEEDAECDEGDTDF